MFFSHYIRAIVEESDYEYLFSYSGEGTNYAVDLQINTNVLELADIRKVYAVAMTSDKDLNLDNFLSLTATPSKGVNLTDVWILIKDIGFVIEVKRDNADCKQQLFDQVAPFLQAGPVIEVKPKYFSWMHAVILMEQVSNIQRLNGLKAVF